MLGGVGDESKGARRDEGKKEKRNGGYEQGGCVIWEKKRV